MPPAEISVKLRANTPGFVAPGGVSALFSAHQAQLPCGCINFRRAIHRFDSANSTSTWPVFFASPLKRAFT